MRPSFASRRLAERAEALTVGIDEASQLIGADPFGRQAALGLRIPSLALANTTPETSRYLFLLSYVSVPKNAVVWICGVRQLVKLGTRVVQTGPPETERAVELEITDPCWAPPGGNISWHLQDLGPPGMMGIPSFEPEGPGPGPFSTGGVGVDNLAFRMSSSPALLYETVAMAGGYYVALGAYTPPNGGQPWGKPLLGGGWSTRYDLAAPWRASQAWHSLDVPVYGPRVIALFASVRQADPTVAGYTLAGPAGYGMPREEAFLTRYPSANYYRIAGSLVVAS